jgi:hypothetical protein
MPLEENVIRQICGVMYADYISSALTHIAPEVYNFQEAILGRDGQPFFDSIPRNTSAGYPFSAFSKNGNSGKQMFFGKGDKYDLTNDACKWLEQHVSNMLEKLVDGQDITFITTPALKDELRSKKKVAELKTRIVWATPVTMLIIMRQLFMAFFRMMSVNRIHNGCAVGINPYSIEWDLLARNLQERSKFVFAGDHKGFDKDYRTSLMLLIIKHIINPWYNDKYSNARIRMGEYITNPVCVFSSWLFQPKNMLASGVFGTAHLQSMKAEIFLRACYYYTSGSRPESFFNYQEHVYSITFGDDHAANVSDTAQVFFNQHSMEKCMKEKFNLVYTSDNKEDKDAPAMRSLHQITFLKRGFHYDESICRYLAPLDLNTILEMPMWGTRGLQFDTIIRENVKTAIMELSLHTDEIFDEWARTIQGYSRNLLQFAPYVGRRADTLFPTLSLQCHM